ncbi:MAG: hypothetical protein WCD47_22365 [Candidatus Sulfotelmatobacter sp.]
MRERVRIVVGFVDFFSFIGYNMDPERFEATVAEGIARAVDEEERADVALLAPA